MNSADYLLWSKHRKYPPSQTEFHLPSDPCGGNSQYNVTGSPESVWKNPYVSTCPSQEPGFSLLETGGGESELCRVGFKLQVPGQTQFLIHTEMTGAEMNASAFWCVCVVNVYIYTQMPWLHPLTGVRSISTSTAMSTPVPRSWLLNPTFQEKECRFPGEVGKSRTGAGKIQDKLGLHCGANKY